MTLVALTAAAIRLAMIDRAPVFINKDSVSFFLPGWDLANGLGLTAEYRRAPLYSLFVAGAVAALGDSLLSVARFQHILGVGMAVGAYLVGRLTFGRGVAIAGGLLTAISGPLLIYEHAIMPETLFGSFMVLGVLLFLRGIKAGGLRWYVAGGVILGLAALARPAGQLVLLALPIALLAERRSMRQALITCLAAAAGFVIPQLPWVAVTSWSLGGVAPTATVGEPLLSRMVHGERWLQSAYRGERSRYGDRLGAQLYEGLYDGQPEFALPDAIARPYTDPTLNEAWHQAIKLSERGESPNDVLERIKRDLDLPGAVVDGVLRDVGVAMIRAEPVRYLTSTGRASTIILLGRIEGLRISWDGRRDEAGRMMEDNWYEVRRIRHLVQPTTPDQRASFGFVDGLVNVFQPGRYGLLIGLLFFTSGILCLARRDRGPGLLLWLVVALLIVTSAMLSWAAPRYRYPVDPLIYILAAASPAALVQVAWGFVRGLLGGVRPASRRTPSETGSAY